MPRDTMSNLSLLNCRLLSVGCTNLPHVQYTISIFPIQGAIRTLSLRRGLVELEDFGIAHLNKQIL